MTARNYHNSKKVMDAMANPTPENKYLRDQYRFSYPTYNRTRFHAHKFQVRLSERFDDTILPYHGSIYQSSRLPMRFFCMKCRGSWETTPDYMTSVSKGCPHCYQHKPRRRPTKTTSEEQQQLRDLVAQGVSFKDITALTGRSYGTIKAAVDEEYRQRRNEYHAEYYRQSL